MALIEFDYYIPPDVTVNDDGTISDMEYVYQFDDRVDFFLYSFTGWGMPPIRYITQRGPFQHGETALDYRLEPRTIQYLHRRLGNCRQDYWDNRSDILNHFRPNRQLVNQFEPGRLRKILPNGDIRDLFVYLEQGPIFTARGLDSWDEFSIQETIRFKAYNPIVFNPIKNEQTWVLANLGNLIFYEAVNWPDRLVFVGDDLDSGGIWFGTGTINETVNITYNGTWLEYPTIIITGPLSNVQIFNNTTGEKIELEYEIPAGETVTINLQYGQKTITNNFGTNLIGTATTDSDIATFHLAPDPEATNGINELQVIGDDAVIGVTEVKVTYNEKYIGI